MLTIFIVVFLGVITGNIYTYPNRKEELKTKEQLIFDSDFQ